MNQSEFLAERFEAQRTHLRSVAYRMLGSSSEADDALQEAWLRLSRADTNDIKNLGGWMTTIVARVCLNMLQSRKSRREEPLEEHMPEPIMNRENEADPEHAALVADSIGPALLVVLDTLAPAERVTFVLHDMFAVPFNEIAPIVGYSPAATRQLASRARRRVHVTAKPPDADPTRQRVIVEAFLAASREGNFDALLSVLDPDVVLRADHVAVRAGASAEIHGGSAVAQAFIRRPPDAQLILVDGKAAIRSAPHGRPGAIFTFTVVRGKIVKIEFIGDPDHLAKLKPTVINP